MDNQLSEIVFKKGADRTLVQLRAKPAGKDWVLIIGGGQHHVGAVATGAAGGVQLSVLGPHKEGPLAEMCAERFQKATGNVCVAIVGIHQDEATPEEIETIVGNVHLLMDELILWHERQTVNGN